MTAIRRAAGASLAAVLMTGILIGCGGGASETGFSKNADVRGEHITVLLPYSIPKKLLDQFTAQTGVDVTLNTAGWDAVHSKLIVANQAQKNIGDVTEFDWSFTGQFAAAGWYEPLEDALDAQAVKDMGGINDSFSADGHLWAACYLNDFRISVYNKQQLAAAGVKSFPRTFAVLGKAADAIKRTNASDYALAIPMGATEGGVTPWYLLTLAMGGQLFDENDQPQFASPDSAGYKALQWEVNAVKKGWVSPAAVTFDDTDALDKFSAGAGAIYLAGAPGNFFDISSDPQSPIGPDVRAGLVPGTHGPGGTFPLPEGLGIPVTSEHKDAALSFINWMLEPKTQVGLYERAGFLPCRRSAVQALARSGELQGGDVLQEELTHIEPLFPGGAPQWYSKFSSEAQGLLNAAVKGDMSVGDALQQLSSTASELAKGGS
jgi:multiple sugar transport system substrate-binding protein